MGLLSGDEYRISNMEKELKPCPFCGSTDIEVEEYLPESCCTKFWKVACTDCCGGFQSEHNKKEAVAIWNRRPMEDALQAHIDRFNSAVKKDLNEIPRGR